jgi:hypothetical protein
MIEAREKREELMRKRDEKEIDLEERGERYL